MYSFTQVPMSIAVKGLITCQIKNHLFRWKVCFMEHQTEAFAKQNFRNSLGISWVSLKLTGNRLKLLLISWIDRCNIFSFLWGAILKYKIFFLYKLCHDGPDYLYHRGIQHVNHGLFKLKPSKKGFKILCSKTHKWQVGFRVLALKSSLQPNLTFCVHSRCFESRCGKKELQKIFQQILPLFQTSQSNLNRELISQYSQGGRISVYKFIKN